MAQDIPQTNWSQYFDSGQNFGNWFNSDFNQQQKLKFEQARAIIDDEMQRQRLGQQQQQINQTGDYYKQLGQEALERQKATAAQQAETNRHNLATEAPDKDMTPADWQKMFLGFAGPTGGQMPIGSALDMMAATPGVSVSPEQRAAALSGAAKVPGQNIGMPSTPYDIVPHQPGMVAPSPDQAFLPGTQEAMARKESLIKQSNARAAYQDWLQRNGNRITKIREDAALAHAKTSILDEQIKQNKLDMAKKWGDKLNQLKIDANDIHSYNAATMRWAQMLRQNETTTAAYKEAKDNARFTYDVIKTQLSDINKLVDATEKELDTNDRHKNLVNMEENALRDVVGDSKDGKEYMQYLEKQADHTAAMQTSVQLKAKLKDLKQQQAGLQQASQNALSLFSKQQMRSGGQVPIPSFGKGLPTPSGINPPAKLGPAQVTPSTAPPRQMFYDKQGKGSWFVVKNGKWVPE